MDNRDRVIHIRCFDTCHYNLAYPQFFVEMPRATLRKIFKWLFQFDYYRENEDTISFLNRELPYLSEDVEAKGKERIADREKVWRDRLADSQKEYLDPAIARMPREWSKSAKALERDRRKKQNADNARRVKDAKADYERAKKQAVKDLERAKEVFALYQATKTESYF